MRQRPRRVRRSLWWAAPLIWSTLACDGGGGDPVRCEVDDDCATLSAQAGVRFVCAAGVCALPGADRGNETDRGADVGPDMDPAERDEGVPPMPDEGVPPTPDEGVSPTPDEGVPPTPDEGVPPTPDEGVPPTPDEGVPPVDAGIPDAAPPPDAQPPEPCDPMRPDPLDDEGIDDNCDGVDGIRGEQVYVMPFLLGGSDNVPDGAESDPETPLATLAEALVRADGRPILALEAEYPIEAPLTGSFQLYGGYQQGFVGRRLPRLDGAGVVGGSRLRLPDDASGEGPRFERLLGDSVIDGFGMRTGDAPRNCGEARDSPGCFGASAYGARFVATGPDAARVRLRNVVVRVGAGAPGGHGVDGGEPGVDGEVGAPGASTADDRDPARGRPDTSDAVITYALPRLRRGPDAAAAPVATGCSPIVRGGRGGGDQMSGHPGGGGAAGGRRGTTMLFDVGPRCVTEAQLELGDGGEGAPGAPGADGDSSRLGELDEATLTYLVNRGVHTPSAAFADGLAGRPGGGGGGGGGAAPIDVRGFCGPLDDPPDGQRDCDVAGERGLMMYGPSGGSGGNGGCGGSAGTGGGHGGISVGVVSHGARLTLERTVISTGGGGEGGRGGAGRPGGLGREGGAGGSAVCLWPPEAEFERWPRPGARRADLSTGRLSFAGGMGGRGGDGGAGGGGGGGYGGSTIGVLSLGAEVELGQDAAFDLGRVGAGGESGGRDIGRGSGDFTGNGLARPVMTIDLAAQTRWHYDAVTDLGHNTGEREGRAWVARVGRDREERHMAFGPYATHFGQGPIRARTTLMVSDNRGGAAAVTLDVYDATADEVLVRRAISPSQFPEVDRWFTFVMDTQLEGRLGHAIELRILWHGRIDVGHLNTNISNDVDGDGTPDVPNPGLIP